MGRPHLLVIPYPGQGHVIPIMELSHNLVDRGFKITFVNTEEKHKRVVASLSNSGGGDYEEFIHLVFLPDDETEVSEDQTRLETLIDELYRETPGHLEDLIRNINESNSGDDRITCVIADLYVPWAFGVAKKMSIPTAAFWPASPMLLATISHVPKLIEDGIIATDGHPIKHQMIHLSPTTPAMNTAHLVWLCMGNPDFQGAVFNMTMRINRTIKLADDIFCNSFYELEPSAFTLLPNLKPIGPLLESRRLAHFWPEDSTCLSWLHQQPALSVLYVAFGSYTILDKQQFDELALGLELSGQPFLWVVRPDLASEVGNLYPDGFEARVGPRGRMVSWCPQRKVLAHPSVGGFLTHCGWNSIMEGLSNGVPFLCWPYFYDQFFNRSYVCDVWKNGLGLSREADGLISREEIKTQVVRLLGDEGIKARALKLKETAMNNINIGGASSKNFDDFVQSLEGIESSTVL